MANTKVTQHVIANNAITADQLASAAVTDAKLHSTLDLSSKTLTLPATAIPSASTATTQAASDNSTKLATTAYVTTAIGNLVDSAPTALDTLNELAAALGDDANFSGTVTTSLAGKLPLAGGTMTGALVLSGAPTSGLHAATKTYVDTADALKLNLTGGTLTGDLILNTTTALQIPVGTTGQRPTAATGQIRWNSTDGAIEVYNGTAWTAVGTGSSNKVLDTFTGDGSTTTFTLSVTPANEDAIMVFIDGAYQEKSDYVLTNNSLVLDTAPLSAEKIAVHITTAAVHDGTSAVNNQFTATAGQTAFTLTQDPSSENNTQVYINGVYQQKTDYTVVGTTLTFDTGLTVGDVVEVNMFTVATLGNTDTVTEGVSNLYHTTARARGAISVSGNALSYNSSTGVITANFEESPTFTSTVTTPTLITGAYGASGSAGDGFRLNSTDLYGQVDASDKVRIAVAGASFFNGGNVGIGTAIPTAILDVVGPAARPTSLAEVDTGSTARFRSDSSNADSLYIAEAASGALIQVNDGATNSTTAKPLALQPFGGNVGIGTASPDYQLHVAGDGDIKIEDTVGGSAHLHIGASTGSLRNSEWRLKTSGSADEFYIDHTYTANDGSSDVAGSGTVLTLKSDANVDVTNDIVANNAKLKAIAESNTDTAVDVFVYDTRKDSDGGAWRKRTQHTSWYNETLNTSTRGARKEFPSVAVIVAESNEVTIYDGDDPDMPMWMTFPVTNSSWLKHSGSGGCKAVVARDGIMVTGGDIRGSIVRFIADDGNVFEAGYNYEHNYITTRNSSVGPATGSISIVNNTINDVAMTVLPNAPIDADTGLPVPTIAVATNGGVSVIKDDGTVVDITASAGSSYNGVGFISFDSNHNMIFEQDTTGRSLFYMPIPSADDTSTTSSGSPTDKKMLPFSSTNTTFPKFNGSNATLGIGGSGEDQYIHGGTGVTHYAQGPSDATSSVAYITSDYNTGWMVGDTKLAALSDTDDTNISASGNTNLLSGGWTNNGSFPYETFTTSGLDITSAINTTAYGAANKTWNSVAGKTYTAYFNLTLNSGTAPTLFVQTSSSWGNGVSYQTVNGVNAFTFTATMSGSTYFNFSVNNGVATNFSVANLELYEGGVADRSSNGKGLSVFGTITKTAVATGAELVAYSGFNASNYLEQSYNSDLDFNSGDFAYCFWSNNPHTGSEYIADRSEGNGNYRTALYMTNTNNGTMALYTRDTAATEVTGVIGTPNQWAQIWCIRRGTSHEIWVNGINKVATSATVRDVSYASGEAVQKIGVRYNNSNHNTGKIALFRVSATAPSAEQIKKIYNDEKHLFATNAKATIAGTSDAVTALAYDDDTELLHVGSSWGRSVFQGLNRVEYSTDVVTTAISASNGFIVEE